MGYESLSELEYPVKDDPHLQETSDDSEDLAETPEIDWDEAGDQEGAMSPFSWRSLPTMGVGMVIGVAIALGGMGFISQKSNQTPSNTTEETAVKSSVDSLPAASQTVTVAGLKSSRVSRTLEATGTVKAYDLLPILPQATGLQIQQVLVDEGDYVTAGQVMAILDDSVVRSQNG